MHTSYRKRRSPKGFTFLGEKDTLLLEERARHAQKILQDEGFKRVMPPGIDFPETFDTFHDQGIFRFRDREGTDLSLRSDVTVQVIKGFCNSLELEGVSESEHRYYYTVPVFRDDKKGSLSLREIYQVGAEMIGTSQNEAIPYLIELSHKILDEAFATEHLILLGDIKSFEIVEKYFNHNQLRSSVKERNAPLFSSILQEFNWSKTSADNLARKLLFAPSNLQNEKEWQAFKDSLKGDNEAQNNFLGELKNQFDAFPQIMQGLLEKGLPIRWEPLLIRDSRYYTGLLFEGYVPQLPLPPLRGGAYDKLISVYSDEDLPATGLAIDASLLI